MTVEIAKERLDELAKLRDDAALEAFQLLPLDSIWPARFAYAKALYESGSDLIDVALARRAEAGVNNEIERCIACKLEIKPGDPYYPDESGGNIHAWCCGPEHESYTYEGEPLKAGQPIPRPSIWQTDEQFRATYHPDALSAQEGR